MATGSNQRMIMLGGVGLVAALLIAYLMFSGGDSPGSDASRSRAATDQGRPQEVEPLSSANSPTRRKPSASNDVSDQQLGGVLTTPEGDSAEVVEKAQKKPRPKRRRRPNTTSEEDEDVEAVSKRPKKTEERQPHRPM